ncbi:hypothetical protein WANG_p1030 (plasmid) [Lactobacillus kefiranofaciens subsp. kefiranofaciens]|nr:hypothetical protein WANG_p1030 [Lactobacillus kefiranofaciens subsp. kefiranofaciens]
MHFSNRIPDKIDFTSPLGIRNASLKEQISAHQQIPKL